VAFSWVYYLNGGYFFILRAGGDTKSVFFMDSGFVWLVIIPVSFFVGRLGLSLALHFLIIQFLEFAKLGVATFMFNKNTWLNNLTITKQKV
jgi:Na+-driven multidrug efflux pump